MNTVHMHADSQTLRVNRNAAETNGVRKRCLGSVGSGPGGGIPLLFILPGYFLLPWAFFEGRTSLNIPQDISQSQDFLDFFCCQDRIVGLDKIDDAFLADAERGHVRSEELGNLPAGDVRICSGRTVLGAETAHDFPAADVFGLWHGKTSMEFFPAGEQSGMNLFPGRKKRMVQSREQLCPWCS
jgi:hypothetical protein